VDHEDEVVISLWPGMMYPYELRSLVRHVCRSTKRLGWEELVEELRCGSPSYPVVDELIKLCVRKIRRILSMWEDQLIKGSLMIDFESMDVDPLTVGAICRQLEKILQGRDHQFHLSLMSMRTDEEIMSTVIALVSLYETIGTDETKIIIA